MGAVEEPRYEEAGYWAMLEATLIEVFGVAGVDARTRVAERQRVLAEVAPAERLLSFHAEPLYVAADIGSPAHDGLSHAVTPDQLERYLALGQRSVWRPNQALHSDAVAAA